MSDSVTPPDHVVPAGLFRRCEGVFSRWWARVRVPLLSAFIICNLLTIGIYIFLSGKTRETVIAPFEGYLNFAALWQSFDVFTGKEPFTNTSLIALVTFADREQKWWQPPTTQVADMGAKLCNDRWSKWWRDAIATDNNRVIYADAARWVARQCAQSEDGGHPTKVELIRIEESIPKPGDNAQPQKNQRTLFTYEVSPADLVFVP